MQVRPDRVGAVVAEFLVTGQIVPNRKVAQDLSNTAEFAVWPEVVEDEDCRAFIWLKLMAVLVTVRPAFSSFHDVAGHVFPPQASLSFRNRCQFASYC
jgi:hypothetical protein